jgi:hypothetical protein
MDGLLVVVVGEMQRTQEYIIVETDSGSGLEKR